MTGLFFFAHFQPWPGCIPPVLWSRCIPAPSEKFVNMGPWSYGAVIHDVGQHVTVWDSKGFVQFFSVIEQLFCFVLFMLKVKEWRLVGLVTTY